MELLGGLKALQLCSIRGNAPQLMQSSSDALLSPGDG
jgi:hypothetical protein